MTAPAPSPTAACARRSTAPTRRLGSTPSTSPSPAPGPHTIRPTTPLPIVSDPAIIDATTQPGSNCSTGLKVELDGTGTTSGHGLQLGGSGSTVRGFVINRFAGSTNSSGIFAGGSGNHVIACNWVGTNVAGMAAAGNAFAGIEIPAGSSGNTIGGAAAGNGNVVSGNRFGMRLVGDTNAVLGNRVGTTANGGAALGNTQQGMLIQGVGNAIGGASAGQGNTISGNGGFGIEVCCASAGGTVVQGNRIGTDLAGTAALPNDSGIQLDGGTDNNTIGGPAAGEGNLISGNSFHGISVGSAGTTSNVIVGNRIGTAADGISPLGNQRNGVYLDDDASGNRIGGSSAGAANVIAFNGNDGVAVGRPASPVATDDIRCHWQLHSFQYSARHRSGWQWRYAPTIRMTPMRGPTTSRTSRS